MTVKQTQCLLLYLGYSPGNPDGVLGQQTRAEVRQFQQDYGCRYVDGVPGRETDASLLSAVTEGWTKPAAQKTEPVSTTETASGAAASGGYQSKYFRREEFRCRCGRCGGFPAEMQEGELRLLDKIREHFGVPGIVSSGVRCAAHNAEVGGVGNSRHLTGHAADVCFTGIPASQVVACAMANGASYSYSIDGSYAHIDKL